jgi:hypothetical protein
METQAKANEAFSFEETFPWEQELPFYSLLEKCRIGLKYGRHSSLRRAFKKKYAGLLNDLKRLAQREAHREISPLVVTGLINQRILPHFKEKNDIYHSIASITLNVFVSTDEYRLIDHTIIDYSNKYQIPNTRKLGHWYSIWMAQHFPFLSNKLLIQVSRYRHLADIPFTQIVAYLPPFMANRLNAINVEVLKWIAKGNNLSRFPALPLPISKKEAHWACQSPEYLTLKEALVYGIVRVATDSIDLFNLLRPFVYQLTEMGAFGKKLIQFVCRSERAINNVELERLIGYVTHRWMETPHFSLKGRKLEGLLAQSQRYYDELQMRRYNGGPSHWQGSLHPDYEETDKGVTYRIVQLTTSRELQEEGNALGHCVAGYNYSCASGTSAIWSLRICKAKYVEGVGMTETMERKVTIELSSNNKIIQARGTYNRLPAQNEDACIRRWASKAGFTIECY